MEETLMPISKSKRPVKVSVPQESTIGVWKGQNSGEYKGWNLRAQEGVYRQFSGLLGKLLYTIMISMYHYTFAKIQSMNGSRSE